jgi:hypothetical protein
MGTTRVLLSGLAVLLAAPVWAAGPLDVDPKHHKLEFENDKVRVIRTDWGPKEVSPDMFDVGDSIVVRITPAHFRVRFADGKVVDRPGNLGAVVPGPAGRFSVENLLDRRVNSIVVELKGGAAGAAPAVARIDPLTSDPAHHGLIFESEKVRVLRAVFRAGETAPGFFDAEGAVIVTLTPTQFEVTTMDGNKVYPRFPSGAAAWFPKGRILPKNQADMTAEFIVIEPK